MRTIKLAAPLAMILITFVYMLVNVAYYAVVEKREILGSGRIIAALFFGKLWGIWTERVCILNVVQFGLRILTFYAAEDPERNCCHLVYG